MTPSGNSEGVEQPNDTSGDESQDLVATIGSTLTVVCEGDVGQRVRLEGLSGVDLDLAERINGTLDALEKRIVVAEASVRQTDAAIVACTEFTGKVRAGNMDARVDEQVLTADNENVATLGASLNATLDAMREQLETIRRQQLVIQELSTPILQVWDDVLVLPVVGVVDSRRAMEMMDQLLSEIVRLQSRYVILDVTGMEIVDTNTADHIIKLIKSAELLGATCIATGIRPAVAQTLVEIGLDMSHFITLRNLQAGLKECLRRMDAEASKNVGALARMNHA